MEFVLQPAKPSEQAPKPPYVGQLRYDGGPFLSYPARVARPRFASTVTNITEYQRSERVDPTPVREQEAFLQTWLYFGLISEFLIATRQDAHITLPEAVADGETQFASLTPVEIVDLIYNTVVVQGTSLIVLDQKNIDQFVEISRLRLPQDADARIKHYDHLYSCLTLCNNILASLPKTFNHAVRCSISAFCELMAQAVRSDFFKMGIQRMLSRNWSVGYLNSDARKSMVAHGWCLSDIARVETKFLSIQAVNVARMMDKSLPKRDHTYCTDEGCNVYQINTDEHQLRHQKDGCGCEELTVAEKDLTRILQKQDCFPLLRLNGDVRNLSVELVESTTDVPFIAISHVWADGLGNPHANSLHRCKLVRLRELVAAIPNPAPEDSVGSPAIKPLIWLDTLCCPAKDKEGKQKAIEKIRIVYQQARDVLVLDSGLMAYPSKPQEPHEKVMRIFTSGWTRRLWTLQEGALAKSLYFQFSDEAISLQALRNSMFELCNSVRYQVFTLDSINEFQRLDGFFHSGQHSVPGTGPNLVLLDQALHFRGVSVASDEALCIGTLMSLDLNAILEVESREERMQRVWGLLATKNNGIPAGVLFVEDNRLETPGWRWAPKSLLTMYKTFQQANVRIIRWGEPQLGTPTPRGLQVRYPGFQISVKKYADGRPRNAWPEMKRTGESYMLFRDEQSGRWYKVFDNRAFMLQNFKTEEERAAYFKLELFPLHDLADTGDGLIVLRGDFSVGDSPEEKLGLFVSRVNVDTKETEEVNGSIAVTITRYVAVIQLAPENGYIYSTAYQLALRLRADPLIDEHLRLYSNLVKQVGNSSEMLKAKAAEDEDFRGSVQRLRVKMQEMMRAVVETDERFVRAVKMYFGEDLVDDIWALIQDWWNHDFVGKRLEADQIWYVD